MKELRVDHLTKTYGEKTLFDDLSFLIQTKDKIGLIGVNGTGKTSLLNILADKDSGDSGDIKRPQDYHIGYLSQDTEFDENLTVAEAVFQGDSPLLQAVHDYEVALVNLAIDGSNEAYQQNYTRAEEKMNKEDAWTADTHAKTILTQLGITDVSKKIKELSGGQKKRVGLAQVLIQEPDLLLLDEPTNHLDYKAIEWLESYLSQYRGALVMVTHDRYFLDKVTNRIFELSFGKLYEYKGNYQAYLAAKSEREVTERAQEHKRKQLYKQELAWMRAGVQARGTKQQARIDRFTDLKENLHQVKENGEVEISLGSQRLGKKVLSIEDGGFEINNQSILNEFNLLVQGRDRIGITGRNGAGKSTLLNILAGRLELTHGVYEIGETVRLAYYTQVNEDMDPNKRMIQYLQEVAEEVKQADGSSASIADMLERFLFPKSSHGTIIGKLSGGEKRRLFLLKLLIAQPNVLLLDEPTNDLDIDTLTVLEDYIKQFNGAIIAVSHDRYFLDKVAEKLLVFQGDGIISEYFGTMSEYLASAKEEAKHNLQTKKVMAEFQATKVQEKMIAEKTKLTYNEKKEWETIESDIETLETKLEGLTEEMNHQGSDFTKLQELQNKISATEEELEEKMTRWEYLSEFV
ncbi:ABC-F family ATP-binding cassette domain-containing protein [Vagococcus intermedius]|uniref:ABC-F family ATP-binding cassette domain-containing protein n=1 Tax=Vagococcus intermedius TaxID=2991418 RepID=A0AAF0CWP9_9ENTE|nr:ABC-F family ATP-binding cassette domain-containing protein [Vagococcus intermedius]WEG74273.1 ABC-F family ATP-binding cassette domain-containing protein [Vagococcus intermedius]WEG76355.1 ABC-F family ATP-binding cassette domain-containing protein [Vagococcus intermedius]